jgi:hypothetical protein
MEEWHFGLEGDEFDLDSIADLFRDEVTIAKDQHGKTKLIVKLPFARTEAADALNAAKGLVAKVNAVNQIVYDCHDSIRLGSIGCKNPETGLMEYFITMGARIKGRARIIVGGEVSGGTPQPPKKRGDQFLAAADKSVLLDRALYLYGSLPHDWRGLFMVLEAAEDANDGESGLIAKNFVPLGQIKDFKGTANSYKALKHEARHGSTTKGFDQAQQTIEQAQQMVRTILQKWVQEVDATP